MKYNSMKILYKNCSGIKILSNYEKNLNLLWVNEVTKMTAKTPKINPARNSVLVKNCIALEIKVKIGGTAK